MLQETNTWTSLEQSLYHRPKKIIVVSGNMDKNRVGRSFFYNGAYKYTKLLHMFLSLLPSSYILL